MGMFDLDKTLGRGVRLDQRYPTRDDKFIVWGITDILENIEIPGSDIEQPATKVVFDCSDLATPDEHFEGAVIGMAIAEKARQAEESDFPAVVHLDHAPSRFGSDALIVGFDYAYVADQETLDTDDEDAA